MRTAILITGAIFPNITFDHCKFFKMGSLMATFRYNLVFMQDSG